MSISPAAASRTCRTMGSDPLASPGASRPVRPSCIVLARAAIVPTTLLSVVAAIPAAPAPAATRRIERRDGAAGPAAIVPWLPAAALAAATGRLVEFWHGNPFRRARGGACECMRSERSPVRAGGSFSRRSFVARPGADWSHNADWLEAAASAATCAKPAASQARNGSTRIGVVVGRLVPPARSTVMPSWSPLTKPLTSSGDVCPRAVAGSRPAGRTRGGPSSHSS